MNKIQMAAAELKSELCLFLWGAIALNSCRASPEVLQNFLGGTLAPPPSYNGVAVASPSMKSTSKAIHLFILDLGNIWCFADAEDKETLTKHGITHILSVHNNAKPLLEVSIANLLWDILGRGDGPANFRLTATKWLKGSFLRIAVHPSTQKTDVITYGNRWRAADPHKSEWIIFILPKRMKLNAVFLVMFFGLPLLYS